MSEETIVHIVNKPFHTATRRFPAGAPVSEADDLAPHTFEDLKDRRFIAPPASEPEPAAPDPRPPSKRAP